MRTHFGVWKTTILGGVIFLLPFAVVVFLLGEIAQVVYTVAGKLETALPEWSFGGVSLAMVAAIVVLLALCYAAGLAARRSFGQRFSERVERNLLLLFPRYAVWKNHLAVNVGAQHDDVFQFRPVLVEFDDAARIGFEIERSAEAADGAVLVAVYMPGSPDPWSGHVTHVRAERVKPLPVNFSDAAALCESMGRGSAAVCAAAAAQGGQK